MARTVFLVCLVNSVSGCCKNALGRGSDCSWHITKLEQSIFSFDIYACSTNFEKRIFSANSINHLEI
jgi:hypothetical protein